MKLIAKKDFSIDSNFYAVGDEVYCKDFNKIVKLNEKGFIKPLSTKELFKIKKELETPKKINLSKEEE